MKTHKPTFRTTRDFLDVGRSIDKRANVFQTFMRIATASFQRVKVTRVGEPDIFEMEEEEDRFSDSRVMYSLLLSFFFFLSIHPFSRTRSVEN